MNGSAGRLLLGDAVAYSTENNALILNNFSMHFGSSQRVRNILNRVAKFAAPWYLGFFKVSNLNVRSSMTASRFDRYSTTSRGQQLSAMIDTPNRYIEFRAFSREGFPAVTALVSVLTPLLEPLRQTDPREFDAAKQYAGWVTGNIMRRHGHIIVRKAASVPGKLFRVAAVWSAEPTDTAAIGGNPPQPAGKE